MPASSACRARISAASASSLLLLLLLWWWWGGGGGAGGVEGVEGRLHVHQQRAREGAQHVQLAEVRRLLRGHLALHLGDDAA
jgi:hypothetical protein